MVKIVSKICKKIVPEGITEDSNLLPSLMLMNVSEVLSPPDSEPLHVCPDRLPIVYRQSVVVVAPFTLSPRATCGKCNRGTKRAKGLFLNNNALLFPWTTAQMSMKSRLPGRHFGTWWSRRQEWRSHRAALFNTCQRANAWAQLGQRCTECSILSTHAEGQQ